MFQQGNLTKRELSWVDEPMQGLGQSGLKAEGSAFPREESRMGSSRGGSGVDQVSDPHIVVLSAQGWVGSSCSRVWGFLIEVKFTYQNEYISSVQFRALVTFTLLYGHYLYQVPEHFYCPRSSHSPLPASLLSWPPLICFLSLYGLPIWDISDKWDHTICGLLCLAYFT